MSAANNALLTNFAIRAVEAQPFGYAESVIKGLALVVEWPRHAYPDPGTVSYYNFPLNLQTIPSNASMAKDTWIPGGTAYQDAVSYGHANPSTIVEPFAAVITLYEHIVYTWGPLLGLILLAGLGGVVRIEGLRQRQPRLVWSRRTGSMMPWVTAIVLLVSPIAVADFDYRYLLPVLPLAGLAAGLAFAPARVPPAPAPVVEQPADAARRSSRPGRLKRLLRRLILLLAALEPSHYGPDQQVHAITSRLGRGQEPSTRSWPGRPRRILIAGESAGRPRRAQAR